MRQNVYSLKVYKCGQKSYHETLDGCIPVFIRGIQTEVVYISSEHILFSHLKRIAFHIYTEDICGANTSNIT